jgi:phytoene dehydrogenase-like protein
MQMEYLDMGTPLTLNHYLNALGGSITSLPHDSTRFAPVNSANLRAETDIPGLYLSGKVFSLSK